MAAIFIHRRLASVATPVLNVSDVLSSAVMVNLHAHMRNDRSLRLIMIAYGTASLVHFAHNAAYLRDYPHMPAWLTPALVWVAWFGVMAVGVLGYLIYRFRSRAIGVMTISVYALLGFSGLDHYAVAPIAAHSIVMNVTIALEAAAAMVLLVYLYA
jgi:hypothetical protein